MEKVLNAVVFLYVVHVRSNSCHMIRVSQKIGVFWLRELSKITETHPQLINIALTLHLLKYQRLSWFGLCSLFLCL